MDASAPFPLAQLVDDLIILTFTYLPINSTMRGPSRMLVQWDATANPRAEDRS